MDIDITGELLIIYSACIIQFEKQWEYSVSASGIYICKESL